MKNLTFFSLLLLLLCSCGYKHISYQPGETNLSEAKQIVFNVFKGQPAGSAPLKIEITDEYMSLFYQREVIKPLAVMLSLATYSAVPGSIADHIVPITVYYDKIKDIKLFKKDVYCINIYDRFDQLLLWAYSPDEAEAKSFIDALSTLRSVKMTSPQN